MGSFPMGTIVAFGDSYTSGLNKPDPNNRYYVTPFVEHVANELGFDLINYGIDGNSNPAITSQILAHDFTEDEFALVTWSGHTRDWDWDPERLRFKKANLRVRKPRELDICYYMSEISIRSAENYLTKNSVSCIMYAGFVEHMLIQMEQWDNFIPGTLKELCEDDMELCQHPNAVGHRKIADSILNDVREKIYEQRRKQDN